MELRQLEHFVAVAEELHFGRAALRRHVAQPALSRAVRALEEELGARLLERTSRSVALTAEGRWMLERARELLGAAESAAATVRRMARGECGALRVLFTGPASQTRLPGLVRSFHERWPEVALELVEMPTPMQLDALARGGETQVGVIRGCIGALSPEAAAGKALGAGTAPAGESGAGGLARRIFEREPYVLAVPLGHPLAAEAAVPLSALEGEPFIAFPRRAYPELHARMERAFAEAGVRPRTVQETSSKVSALGLVAAGLGVTLVPESMRRLAREGVAYVHLASPNPLPEVAYQLVWRAGEGGALLERFVAHVCGDAVTGE
jgi:DNA-binding transcriptional LysR family regulator